MWRCAAQRIVKYFGTFARLKIAKLIFVFSSIFLNLQHIIQNTWPLSMSSNGNDSSGQPKNPSDFKGEANPYIPKFISTTPWYSTTSKDKDGKDVKDEDKNDYLKHQRKDPNVVVDYSVAQAGGGISDEIVESGKSVVKNKVDYDSKRDRWFGYLNEEWDKVLQNWEKLKANTQKRRKLTETVELDSDDTDYELELVEMNLSRDDIRTNTKEDPLEKMMRDRQDVPSYIYNITSDPNNKIRVEYDPKSRLSKDTTKGFLNDDQQFVKKLSTEGQNLTELQKFAWEIDQKEQKERQKESLAKSLEAGEYVAPQVNLDLSVEASPTLMMMKQRKHREELDKAKS